MATDQGDENIQMFYRFLLYFPCDKFPVDLFVRACRPKSVWSPTGEVILRSPREGSVPRWLINTYGANEAFFHSHSATVLGNLVRRTLDRGIWYLERDITSDSSLRLLEKPQAEDDPTMIRDWVSVLIHAFPSQNTEIVGEEMTSRLLNVAVASVLPLLASLPDAQLEDLFMPREYERKIAVLFSLFDLLYQTFGFLGYDRLSVPASLPKRLLAIAGTDISHDCKVYCNMLVEIMDIVVHSSQSTLQSSFLSKLPDPLGERNNATIGSALSILSSTEHEQVVESSKILTATIAKEASRWSPLSQESVSTMEYLAANSLGNIPPLSSIGKPVSNTVDTIALSGLLLARSRRCDDAVKILDKALKAVQSHYGITSMQYNIVVAEMASCCNMLRDESQAEKWARTALDARLSSPELLDRPDQFYPLLALADSLIGRGKYGEALPLLQDVVENRQASDTVRMISILRLVKSRRRLHQEARAFDRNSPLLVGLPLLNRVPAQLQTEYLEELACNLSIQCESTPKTSGNTQEIVEAVETVNRMLDHRLPPSIADTPGLVWYRQVQHQYLDHATQNGMIAPTHPQSEPRKVSISTPAKPNVALPELRPPYMVDIPRQGDLSSPEAKKRSRAIDRTLAEDARRLKRECTVLLLGSESKSELVKQMRIIYQTGFSGAELLDYRSTILRNVVRSAKGVVGAMKQFDIVPTIPANRKYVDFIAEYTLDPNPALPLGQEFCDALSAIWSDACIAAVMERQAEFYLMDSAIYFIEGIRRISSADYLPDEMDVLQAKINPSGISETRFQMGRLSIKMVDINCQRSGRKKWINAFENVPSILFVVDMDEYDEVFFEESNRNRMMESMVLFDSIVNS